MIGTVQGGRYRILEKLGEGGMGEVYLAEHMNLGRRDALKMIRRDLANDSQFVSRFRREARATNRLQHPNIISIYDFGRGSEGRYFLAMEYARGIPLHRMIAKQGPLSVERALHLLLQLVAAVDHAHARGVVHRDLRPENLMIDVSGKEPDHLKVLDFGLAKILAPEERESMVVSLRGQVFGTPAYMSPEQFQGTMADPRSDLYAIGCLAFEMLVGKPPFLGRPVEVMCAQATRVPERPRQLRPQARIPEKFEGIIMRCLEKQPERRFQASHELLAALEHLVSNIESRRVLPTRSRFRRRRLFRPDFECADTDVTPPPGSYASVFEAAASTDREWKKTVRELAETLMDGGKSDLRLVMHLTELRQTEGDLVRTDAELTAIEKQIDQIEQAAREREGTLRFAIGELVFARQENAGDVNNPPEDLDRQIAELEGRLANGIADFARQTESATERAIQCAASRAQIEEKIDGLYTSLDAWILQLAEDRRAPNWQHDSMRKLGERWITLRKSRTKAMADVKRTQPPQR